MGQRPSMRIFIATGIFHPEPGGPATYLYHLLPALQARGHDVTVLTYGDAPASGYPYPVVRISRRQSYPARRAAYWRAARELWPGHDVAYLHTLGLPLPAAVRPRVAKIVGDKAWERAVNRSWVSPGTDVDRFQSERQPLPAELNKWLRARQARGFDHVLVPSDYLRRMVLGWGVPPERVTVVYNALQQDASPPPIDQAQARRQLGLPGGPLLLTAARLTAWKGVDHTLRALAVVDGVRLAVAGDGPARAGLEALAVDLGLQGRVRFAGQVPRGELPTWFRAADYTLLYSGYEGLPHVLLESLAAGTPVIASDRGGNPEVVRHGVNGLLVPHVDVEALAGAIRAAFEPGRRAALAANAPAGLERFAWDELVEQTLAALAAVGED